MTTKTSKTFSDYRERANRVRELANVRPKGAVKRCCRYDEIADSAAGSASHKRAKRTPR
jgi:hypothetical protein